MDLEEDGLLFLENYLVRKAKCFALGCRVKHLEDEQDEGTVVGILQDPDNEEDIHIFVYWDNEGCVGRHIPSLLYLYTNGKPVSPTILPAPAPKIEALELEYFRGFHDAIKDVLAK